MQRILVVDDEKSMLEFLEYMLEKEGYRATSAGLAQEALRLLEKEDFDLVISDLRMPDMDGLELLKKSRRFNSEIPFIFITAYASSETAIEALKLGAFDYVTKPFQVEELRELVKDALAALSLKRRVKVYTSDRKGHGRSDTIEDADMLIGVSPPMLKIYKLIGTIAPTDSTVLISGESGTGKELVAKAIHQSSPRREEPFVSVNCGALAESLLESELFGYVKGAFTGAVVDKKGLFETAEGGTLFLDEVGEMSSAIQVKLLRALQEKKVRPVGGLRETSINVRLVAATNRKLEEGIQEGKVREDLYYRLAVIPIHLPPLRERESDILTLVHFFIHRYNRRLDRKILGITEEGLACLERYHWPGNVRELENVIERAVALEQSDFIQKDRLPEKIRGAEVVPELPVPTFSRKDGLKLQEFLEKIERLALERALDLAGGNQKVAAEILSLSYRSFRHRLERQGLKGRSSHTKTES